MLLSDGQGCRACLVLLPDVLHHHHHPTDVMDYEIFSFQYANKKQVLEICVRKQRLDWLSYSLVKCKKMPHLRNSIIWLFCSNMAFKGYKLHMIKKIFSRSCIFVLEIMHRILHIIEFKQRPWYLHVFCLPQYSLHNALNIFSQKLKMCQIKMFNPKQLFINQLKESDAVMSGELIGHLDISSKFLC